ncbi:variable large family protein (plasmid) [Borreliella americana]|uniref:Variable large family protein n=1 Tax=Borreliella americana TaxID=478807 RepID=A0ACD5G6F9_9SPIR
MRKSSSAILLATLIAFTNCKSDAGKTTSKDDTVNKFYQSIIKLGNGFIDVFSSFGGLITDILGFKADPKKSDVKNYFDAIAKKLEETAKSLEKLTKDNEDIVENTVESAVTGTSGWLKEMIDAAKKAGEKNGDAGESIGNVAAAGNNGAQGDAGSVKAIAGGMKGIVDAAKKAGVELKVDGGGGAGNVDVGKLFNVGGHAGANDAAIGKAADAVSKVSGKQILHAIVTSGDGGGAKASAATNPIDAAIGADGNDANGAFGDNMQKNDAIAAALVLRGMAKGGKFALDGGANGQKSLKNAVESAVTKTVGALTEIIGEAVRSGLKGIGDAVKKQGNGGPENKAPKGNQGQKQSESNS